MTLAPFVYYDDPGPYYRDGDEWTWDPSKSRLRDFICLGNLENAEHSLNLYVNNMFCQDWKFRDLDEWRKVFMQAVADWGEP